MSANTQQKAATKFDLENAVQEIKNSINAHGGGTKTYAQATGGLSTAAQRPKSLQNQNQELKEKQIFISTRNVDKGSSLFTQTPLELTKLCNQTLTIFSTQVANGGFDMLQPIRGVSRSNAGNLTLTFKTTADAERARIHADEWVDQLDTNATIPQRLFAVVAHNVPASTCDGDELKELDAIRAIEDENSGSIVTNLTIAKITWLNGAEAREKTNRGPLMISFKSRKDANAAIDQCIVFNSEICNISLYIPRAPQCFRCQDWGHRATECTGEARCGICAGDHETSSHTCTHDNPCSVGQRCTAAKPKCANCGGDHTSWIRSCPAARAAFMEQTKRDEYRTGRYESSTPFSFADISFKAAKSRHKKTRPEDPEIRATSDNPDFNLIPPTSPITPDLYA